MKETQVEEWVAYWDCPYCGNQCSDIEHDVHDKGDHYGVRCHYCDEEYTVKK